MRPTSGTVPLVAASLVLGALVAACSQAAEPATHDLVYPGADVILISIDTLRADSLSCYGHPGGSSPAIDQVAREGILFEEMYSASPTTASSHASMFTGLAPSAHQASNMRSPEKVPAALDKRFATLAEHFVEAGYQTVAYTDSGLMMAPWRLLQGFERKFVRDEDISERVSNLIAFLDKQRSRRPLFLFVHTYQVHGPYLPPIEFEKRFVDPEYDGPILTRLREVRQLADEGNRVVAGALRDGVGQLDEDDRRFLRALYDAEVAYTDTHLGWLFRALRRAGRLERTILVVTSDHGEEFGEHGRYGHSAVYRETVHVPFVLRLPDGAHAGTRVRGPVSGLDVAPTILDAAGLPPGVGGGGESLLKWVAAGDVGPREVFSETVEHLCLPGLGAAWFQAIRAEGRVLVRHGRQTRDREELFDAALDPLEEAPRWRLEPGEEGGVPREATDLRSRLDRWIAHQVVLRRELLGGGPEELAAPLGPEELRMLEQLGYAGER